jgi:type II secretory pathway pseudopilin PulG
MKTAHSGGFTYLGILAFVAITGLLSAKAMVMVSTSQRSEDERHLLYVGAQFEKAFASYYHATPPGQPAYPASLKDLEQDPRFTELRRHLRGVHIDPITREREWGLIMAAEGGIKGVHSLSEATPLKKGGFKEGLEYFAEASHYHQWVFEFHPAAPPGTAGLQPPEMPVLPSDGLDAEF